MKKCLGLDCCCIGKHDTIFKVSSRHYPRGVWWITCALCWSFTPLRQCFSEFSISICVPYIFQYNLHLLHMMYILSSPFYKIPVYLHTVSVFCKWQLIQITNNKFSCTSSFHLGMVFRLTRKTPSAVCQSAPATMELGGKFQLIWQRDRSLKNTVMLSSMKIDSWIEDRVLVSACAKGKAATSAVLYYWTPGNLHGRKTAWSIPLHE